MRHPPFAPHLDLATLAAAAESQPLVSPAIHWRLTPMLALAALLFATGCITENPPPRAAGTRSSTGSGPDSGTVPRAVRELNLLAMPTALNLDARPGADGVAIKIFAVRVVEAKATPLREGRLEILAFEGTLETSRPTDSFQSWSFTSDDLRPLQFTAALGTGYNLLLNWSPKVLRGSRLTLIARDHPPQGPPIASAPSFVAATTL